MLKPSQGREAFILALIEASLTHPRYCMPQQLVAGVAKRQAKYGIAKGGNPLRF